MVEPARVLAVAVLCSVPKIGGPVTRQDMTEDEGAEALLVALEAA